MLSDVQYWCYRWASSFKFHYSSNSVLINGFYPSLRGREGEREREREIVWLWNKGLPFIFCIFYMIIFQAFSFYIMQGACKSTLRKSKRGNDDETGENNENNLNQFDSFAFFLIILFFFQRFIVTVTSSCDVYCGCIRYFWWYGIYGDSFITWLPW